MKLRFIFILMGVLVVSQFLLNDAEACRECTFIVGAYPGPWWCTYTDCDGVDACTDALTHNSYCLMIGSCQGTLPKWLCVPQQGCVDPEPDDEGEAAKILNLQLSDEPAADRF